MFADAVTDRATAIIVGHNHPSGTVHPSNKNFAITRSLVEAGRELRIRVLDHIVFAGAGHYSLLKNGELYRRRQAMHFLEIDV